MKTSRWLPIADAPRDGTFVKVSYVRENRGGRHVEKCKWESKCWMTGWLGTRFANGVVEPTHFMPLDRQEGVL